MSANEIERVKTFPDLVPEDIGATVRVAQTHGSTTGVLEEFHYSRTTSRRGRSEPTTTTSFCTLRVRTNDFGLGQDVRLSADTEIVFLKPVEV